MAEVSPLRALHYDLEKVGSLADVVAPPYDVIDEEQRIELVSRSPQNVVELDLPRDRSGGDPYERAARLLDDRKVEGILTRDAEPAVWALEQDYEAPDGTRLTRRGFLARVRLAPYGEGIRPHERTQPGPKEDRLRLTRATRHNLSPIFALHPGDAWRQIQPALPEVPWAEVIDGDGTTHRIWRIADERVHQGLAEALAPVELLIADGHHRYETALTYQREIGGAGDHDHVLICLVSLEDPGLTVFPTHRLISGLAGHPERQEAVGSGLKELFDFEEVPMERIDPAGAVGIGVYGYLDSHFRRGYRLRLRGRILDGALADRSPAYRHLDAAILEELVLKRVLRMSDEDIAAKRGIGYTPSPEEAIAALDEGADAAFLLRPTPIEQVREVAAAGEIMPPKSTYFFPKLLTGIVFNPLS